MTMHVIRPDIWTAMPERQRRYALSHWDGLERFLEDGRIERDTNCVARARRAGPPHLGTPTPSQVDDTVPFAQVRDTQARAAFAADSTSRHQAY
jgi:hypothetical protein